MCGIAGILGQADKTNVQTMMKRMAHRGPDAEGVFDDGTGACVLGHTRLSIMDPEGGDQPIYNESSDKVVIANGEIYNFPKLKTVAINRLNIRECLKQVFYSIQKI